MFRKPWKSERAEVIEGRACFFINSAIILAESLSALITGPIIGLAGSSTAAITISCLAAALGIVFSVMSRVPNHNV